MTIWYVRPSGGSYGAEDGTSYDDAWDGFTNIIWGGAGFNPGDTLWLDGNMTYRETLTIETTGTSGNPIIIRSNYLGDSAIISGLDIITDSWTATGINNEWYITLPVGHVFVMVLMKDGNRLLQKDVSQIGSLSTEEWCYKGATRELYYKPTTGSPSGVFEKGTREYCIYIDSKSYVTLANIHTRGSSRSSSSPRGANIFITDSDNITVENCESYYSGRDGITFYNSYDCFLQNNTVYNARRGISIAGGCHDITIKENTVTKGSEWHKMENTNLYGGDTNGIAVANWGYATASEPYSIIIEKNYVYDIGNTYQSGSEQGVGITIRGKTDESVGDLYDVDVRYNKVHGNYGTGIIVASCPTETSGTIDVHHNLVYDNGAKNANATTQLTNSGIYAHVTDLDAGQRQDTNIYNNIVYANDGDHSTNPRKNVNISLEGKAAVTHNVSLKNNIVNDFQNAQPGYEIFINSAGDFSFIADANNYYRASGNLIRWDDMIYTTAQFSNYKTDRNPQETNSISSDSQFTNPSNANFALQSSSSCIDAGADLGANYDDALHEFSSWPDGVETDDQNNHGPGWDIGAIFYAPALRGGCGVEALGLGI